METTPNLDLAFEFIEFTGKSIFLTGKAGTGKTTFLRELKRRSPKRMVVLAPTGVAAINAGGVTIHSFFQLPFGPYIAGKSESFQSDDKKFTNKYSREKINIIRSMDLLVIDEISMVRADLLDAVSDVLCRYKDRTKPFGGVQLLMIGDLQQLAPVVKEEEWGLLKNHYESPFFFCSKALKASPYISIELTKVFRQSDENFLRLLNKVRDAKMDEHSFSLLNKQYMPDFSPADEEGYITLTTHNYQAQRINNQKLENLKAKEYVFTAEVKDDFPEYSFPTDQRLVLKAGAQVMFVKNDTSPDKRYYNGKIGRITDIGPDKIHVLCGDEKEVIKVDREEWTNTKYTIDPITHEISESIQGIFRQYPLKTAWAITIHKSQGLTFEKAIIDAASAFAHGQVYVAL
ncbi:AAA family ATPase, partial [Porphyromonadaceae bacterium OttesenSCG-928-L07]|nr:AAA family ATPase [Porphyromonadaceae bacterium OttesenSCG-928-L07]